MPPEIVDSQTLYRYVGQIARTGLRISTYKLATISALVDFSVKHCPATSASELEVPLPQLARMVMAIYWDQLKPLDGTQLRQSTQPQSRIFDAIESLRSAADCSDDDLKLENAAGLAPGVFRRSVDTVGVCLAQQPLPRLQRVPGSARSYPMLYDDSFLHDNVTRAELARHRNAIQLNPGVAQGLALYERQLHQILRIMWVHDVIRINKLPHDMRQKVEEHLFGHVLADVTHQPAKAGNDSPVINGTAAPIAAGFSNSFFAMRLNGLIAVLPDYSSGEVAAEIRKTGFPMTVSYLTRLQAGVGSAPSQSTIEALAKHFGVDPGYFFGPGVAPNAAAHSAIPPLADPAEDGEPQLPHSTRSHELSTGDKAASTPAQISRAEDNGIWGQVFGDDLDQIAAACQISDTGCWIRPSNTPVRCRPRGDNSKALNLPQMGLHRWAWMVANGCSNIKIPTYLIHVRRTCSSYTCCNPKHLFVTSRVGAPLSKTAIAALLRNLGATVDAPDDRTAVKRRIVLQDNLASIRNYCELDSAGCWIATSASPVACRAEDDDRADDNLPMIAPHRWVWMIVHGYASKPLPGNIFHVRRQCGKEKCCRPAHLYLTTPQGHAVTPDQAEAILRVLQDQADASTQYSKRHTQNNDPPRITRPSHELALFADRLNKLFETSTGPEGIPFTSGEVASALQEDGLTISESLIERLRAASASAPTTPVTEALAFFFNVEVDYFSAGTHALEVIESVPQVQVSQPPESAIPEPVGISPPSAAHTQVLEVTVADLGQIVTGLSEAASECLSRGEAETQLASRLVWLISEVGSLLSLPREKLIISRPLLRRITVEWRSAAQIESRYKPILDRFSRLAEDD